MSNTEAIEERDILVPCEPCGMRVGEWCKHVRQQTTAELAEALAIKPKYIPPHPPKAATDTQDAPPETCSECCGINANQPVDLCPRHRSSTAEGLAEVLRGLATRMFETGPCWCDIPNPELGQHEDFCVAARAAIARYEGKQQP